MADIKIWMLTGDKGETAYNIGISCGLVDQKNDQIIKLSQINKE